LIRIANKSTYEGSDGVYVGRPSLLGNPYTHLADSQHAEFRVSTREEAVEMYRGWLQERIEEGGTVAKAFENLVSFYADFGELTLVCWCAPKRCHAEILKQMIEERVNEVG